MRITKGHDDEPILMQQTRRHLFARAGRTSDQYPTIGRRHLADGGHQLVHHRRLADNIGGQFQTVAQIGVFAFELGRFDRAFNAEY